MIELLIRVTFWVIVIGVPIILVLSLVAWVAEGAGRLIATLSGQDYNAL
jgi:type III secretory pathway component EscT